MKKRLFITAHSLATYPYTSLNTDDTGRPKTCQNGGVSRGRISSQSIKHGMRKMFDEEDNTTLHTRHIGEYITDRLIKAGVDEKKAAELSKKALSVISCESGKDVVGSFSIKQAGALLDVILSHKDDKKAEILADEVKKALGSCVSVDQICFGRKFASAPDLDIDGIINVGHGFTTHKAMIEPDYFTACDDLTESGGAAHIGRKDGMSGTFYRYMSFNLFDLASELEKGGYDLKETLRNVLSSFAFAQPSGGGHNHDNESMPSYVEFDIRTDRAFSYSCGFDTPVQAGENGGFEEPSVERLKKYAEDSDKSFGAPAARFIFEIGKENIDTILDEVAEEAEKMTRGEA